MSEIAILNCEHCKEKIKLTFSNKNKMAIALRKLGPFRLFCVHCAKTKHHFDTANFRKNYVTCRDIQRQKFKKKINEIVTLDKYW